MKAKVREALSLWKKKRTTNTREPDTHSEREAAKRGSPEKAPAPTDREKFEKAISFFKQRHGNGSKPSTEKAETPAIDASAAETVLDVLDREVVPAAEETPFPPILPDRSPAERPPDTRETPVHPIPETSPPPREAPDGAVKKQQGWVSPVYAQCRAVQLNPAYIAENRCLAYLDNSPGAEAYRVLRTHILQQTRVSGMNTIMITSAVPREGKTVTAMNLAFSLAREFENTVLLVDADLRKQSVHKYLGYESDRGLMDYLMDGMPVAELMTWPGIEKMTIISGGRTIQESAELLGSPRMRALVDEVKGRYPDRYVIFDAPSLLAGADALTLATLVDQVIVVVHANKTPLDDVTKAIQLLPREKILGFVMNRYGP